MKKILFLMIAAAAMSFAPACQNSNEEQETPEKKEEVTKSQDVDLSQYQGVIARYSEDYIAQYSSHDEFVADDGEYHVNILFSTDYTVKDFKVLKIQLAEADADGQFSFSTEEIYSQPMLTPEKPLVVKMVFLGSIPNNGISYVDGEGMTKYFSVSQSGVDGSIELSPIVKK